MDLGRVEVIKARCGLGVNGAGAIGGVINLLSRRPGAEPAEEVLLNRSTRGATNAVTPRFDYDFLVPGAFAQYDLTVSYSLRCPEARGSII